MLGARLVLEHTSTTRFRTAWDMLVDAVGPAREWPPYTREATSLEDATHCLVPTGLGLNVSPTTRRVLRRAKELSVPVVEATSVQLVEASGARVSVSEETSQV